MAILLLSAQCSRAIPATSSPDGKTGPHRLRSGNFVRRLTMRYLARKATSAVYGRYLFCREEDWFCLTLRRAVHSTDCGLYNDAGQERCDGMEERDWAWIGGSREVRGLQYACLPGMNSGGYTPIRPRSRFGHGAATSSRGHCGSRGLFAQVGMH